MAERLSYGAHMRAVLVLGLPLIGSHVAQIAVAATDTLMLGWYAVEALAAVSIATSLMFTLLIVGSGFAWAVMPIVAAVSEAGDDTQVRRVTRMGMWLSLLFAALVMPMLWFSEPLMILLGQEPEIAAIAQGYLRIAGWGLFPALIVMTLKAYLSALERTQIVLWVTVAAAVLNVGLNYVLIFGNFGAPEMGARGAALASVILQLVSVPALALYAGRVFPEHALFVRFWRPDWPGFGQVFRLGWPIGLTSFAESGLFSATAVMMGWLGAAPLAAHGIALQLAAAMFMVHVGLSQAATVRAGRALGRRDPAELRRGGAVACLLSLCFALVTVTVFLTLPEPLIGLFLAPDDPARSVIIPLGVGLLAVAALFQLADAAQVMALGLLRGVQDTRVPMVMAAISYWGIGLPASYLLGFGLGLGGQGVWAGLVIGLSVAAALLSLRFWRRALRMA